MNKQFNDVYRQQLQACVSGIENTSNVELVVVVKPQSARYADAAAVCGALMSFVVLSLFLFLPQEFGTFLIYTGTLVAFPIGFGLCMAFPPLWRLFIRNNSMRRYVDIMSRAVFQQVGMYNTLQRTGLLIYVSLLEQKVVVMPDKGLLAAVPKTEWSNFEQTLNSIFATSAVNKALLEKISTMQPVFAKYLPPNEVNINELPDYVEINF